MNLKSEDFLYIEKCMAAVKAGIDIDLNLKKVANTLNRLFDLDLNIRLVDNGVGSFFGANVFPSDKLVAKITNKVLQNKCTSEEIVNNWYENKEWHIELDSILLSEFGLNASPAEIVAVILHELGIVVYFDKVPLKFTNIVRRHVIGLNHTLKSLARDDKIRQLFYFPLIEACSVCNFRYDNTMDDEYLCENKFMYDQGYKDDYDTFIIKLVSTLGNTLVDRTDAETDKDIRSMVNWCITNIKQLEMRKWSLKLALQTEILKTPSYYIKRMTQNIYRSFFGSTLDSYRTLLSEAYMEEPKDVYGEMLGEQYLSDHIKRVVTESARSIWDKKGNLKKINQSDIDILAVESERIESTSDKIYLLDKLYSQLDIVETALDYLNSTDKELSSKVTQSKSTLESFKKQLNELRSKILATKIIEKHYGIYYRTPVGYQG